MSFVPVEARPAPKRGGGPPARCVQVVPSHWATARTPASNAGRARENVAVTGRCEVTIVSWIDEKAHLELARVREAREKQVYPYFREFEKAGLHTSVAGKPIVNFSS